MALFLDAKQPKEFLASLLLIHHQFTTTASLADYLQQAIVEDEGENEQILLRFGMTLFDVLKSFSR